MSRYVDPRTGEPVTAYSELTQTEWALFIDDDWKVRVQLHDQRRPALRELRHVQGQRRHAAQPDLRLRLDLQRAARRRARGLRRQVLSDRQQQPRAAPRLRVGSEGRRQDVGARRLRARVRPADEPAGRELPPQPAAARDGRARAVLRHAAVHLQPRRSVEAVSWLSGRSGAAGRPRPAQRRHRRARQPDDRRSEPAQSVHAQLVPRRAARDRLGIVADVNYLGSAGPQPVQRLQHQPLRRRSARRPVRRVQSELPARSTW